jgi:RNA-splicing ligase RtcB
MFSNLGKIDPKIVPDKAEKITHFGAGGRQNPKDIIPEPLKNDILNNLYLSGEKSLDKAQKDLRTQGNGNHFLFVGYLKSSGETVLVTHHGSRSFGALLFKKGNDIAEKFRKEIAPNVNDNLGWIPMDTEEGVTYWNALQVVREWTKLNHTLIHTEIASKINVNIHDNYWNEHNFVFKKDNTYIHAKGATPLLNEFVPDSTNGLRLIPLNMRDGILIVNGEETETNLGFTSHGAGREMSRTEYTKISLQNKTGYELFDEDTRGLDVRFYTGKMDITELPSAYKNAEKVKNQIQKFNLGNIVDEIIPYGCLMAGHEDHHWKK